MGVGVACAEPPPGGRGWCTAYRIDFFLGSGNAPGEPVVTTTATLHLLHQLGFKGSSVCATVALSAKDSGAGYPIAETTDSMAKESIQ